MLMYVVLPLIPCRCIQCWCGDIASNTAENSDYAVYGESVCDYACDGNPDEICGGYDANSVYVNSENFGT